MEDEKLNKRVSDLASLIKSDVSIEAKLRESVKEFIKRGILEWEVPSGIKVSFDIRYYKRIDVIEVVLYHGDKYYKSWYICVKK